MRLRAARAVLVIACLALGFATSLVADIVVLTSGDLMKVKSYEVGVDTLRVRLVFGGTMDLPLSVVERILDDELASESPNEARWDLVGVELGFDESQPVPDTEYAEMFYEVGRIFAFVFGHGVGGFHAVAHEDRRVVGGNEGER